ncbi:cation-translocating P-type ATPase [Loigolactobacillus coryniformis]|uniref:P-type Ca(2+) transporter n=1 Tax=Loigolactobacillus coryniformis subsp. coryniformis CECT 5711 TaxID=1185325 RepID=J2ZSH8_9LACO|nr:cation-translocating P-type ATPase [Loigolactobacillus coryniformis]EJN55906.1 Cation transporting P-type ATPase [Loigolactobacillus coryniformis subsp. coryniformis CECT 5711]MBW4803425.1 cation-translocating P-type ATPase [Loigolactobacillus coryniformis subsp. torquens]MBW4806121.1 cation-translocating P-type ATPase [Loigolactobacillus coryniformis subsp. torquens]MDC4186186.1 cation-translocating P-type ATPase [Loigolactobacillus coryniformis]
MAQEKKFYSTSTAEVQALLHTAEQGLTKAEADKRLREGGANSLVAKRRKTIIERFIDQFKDFMIAVLLVAAIVAAFSGEIADAVIILLVVVLNAIFGVFQEVQAEAAIDALKEMSAPMAHVRRDGELLTIKSEDVVPGDIVLLEAGDVVPADLRLIAAQTLRVEEAALTGESVPVEKQTGVLDVKADEKVSLGDQTNMAFMNSNITNGRGTGVVVATGMQTEVGRIAGMLNQADETKTPLQENLNSLGKTLTWLILFLSVLIFALGLLNQRETVLNMLLTAISLAVAAIPEGLPAIVTVTLALGTRRMAKRNAIVRKLPAVETLGSTDIIASDKTGTLTQNKMTVERLFTNNRLEVASESKATLDDMTVQIMTLANDTKIDKDGKLLGDPTETALVQFGLTHKLDVPALLERLPRVNEVPFDSERKLMTTIHELADGRYLVATKGAPDQLLQRATQYEVDGTVEPMDDKERDLILNTNTQLARQALRVLGMAYKIVTELPETVDTNTVEQEMIFTGLIGMIDPERPEVEEAVREAKEAGIRPMMITGDHRETAEAIAKRLGIIGDHDEKAIISGNELDEMSDDEFAKRVGDYSVYARVAPEHKVRIVNAWQKRGKVVAMTGDGVNDAPALKAADIGIGMGITGTEVSKNASDMVLADDNFSTIVVAVEEGRKVFANIQKAIQYLLSANLGEVLTLFMMTILGWQILAPVQILWINLVTDTFPAIALGIEPMERDIMKRKPRGRKSNFLSGGLSQSIIYQGLLEGAITLIVYWIGITYPMHASDSLAHADALTMAFATLGLIQLFHAFNVKSIYGTIFHKGIFANHSFNWAILASTVLMAATILIPGFNQLFHVTPLDWHQWLTVLGGSFSIVIIVEIVKFVQRRMGMNK